MGSRSARLVAAAGAGLLLVTACGDGDDDERSVTVFAAASLTDAFDAIGEAFETADPGVEVELAYAGSSALREQILGGAPADVFASANASTMEQVLEAGEAGSAETFARNRLAIAVPAGNPAGITGLADFAEEDLLLGLCAEEVPCGQFGREALDAAGVTPALDTEEPDVRSLLGKVEAGELDAGLVYVTDVLAAGEDVDDVAIPDEHNVVATYPIAVLRSASDVDLAEAFVAFVLSDEGQGILASFGFEVA
jgi:molybdate transport system substrate-binding protein